MARRAVTQLNRNMRTNRPQRYRHVVRVRPITENAKKFVRHPFVGGFTGGDAGTVWPKDSFTMNRLRDGDIEIVEAKKEEGQEQGQEAGSESSRTVAARGRSPYPARKPPSAEAKGGDV